MSQEKTTLEIIAPTVEEAIQKGLSQLNLPQEAVDVEVLDAGSRGLFGLGSRQARIRLAIKSTWNPAAPRPQRIERQPEAFPRPSEPSFGMDTDGSESAMEDADEVLDAASDSYETAVDLSGLDETLRASTEVVSELLEKMKVRTRVTAVYRDPDEDGDDKVVLVNVEGNDLSILIGRRSETLNALQYISSLIISKRLDRWVPLMIDVQGYRARRERQLRQIARRMAEQAMHTGRRQVLEPMPANERRVIHLELRDHPDVMTESIGEEPNRKVTISKKQN